MAIHINGIIGKNEEMGIDGFTLEKLIPLAKAETGPEINLWIRTEGGDLQEAKDCVSYLKSLKKPINTYWDGNVDSAGTVFGLAGTKRIGFKGKTTSLIHNVLYPINGLVESSKLKELGESGASLNKEMAKFYADNTDNTVEAFERLMRDETELDDQKLLEIGFLTEVREAPLRAVAFTGNKNKMANETISKEEAKELKAQMTGFEKFMAKVEKLVAGKAIALVVQDATGTDIDFQDLEADASPELGNTATVDGSPADGEYVMPSGETYVFASGSLTEIKPAESEEEESAEALKTENANLKAELDTIKASNLKLEKAQTESAKQLKAINGEFTKIKATFGSAFNYNPEMETEEEADKADKASKNRASFLDD